MFQRSQGLKEEQDQLTHAAVRDLLCLSLGWDLVRALLLAFFLPHIPYAFFLLLTKNIFVVVVPFLLWRQGRARDAAWWMAICATIAAASYMIVSGGIRSSGPIAEIAMAIMAAIVLGTRGVLFIGVPTTAYLAGVTVFQALGGKLPGLIHETYWTALVNVLAAGTLAFAPIPRALGRLNRLAAERLRMTAELLASNVKLESLMNAVDGIVWDCDPDTGQFTFVSAQAERLLGYPVGDWLDRAGFWLEHVHPDDRKRALARRNSATPGGPAVHVAYRMIAADGGLVWLRDHFSVVIGNEVSKERGAARAHLRGLMVDVTKLHQVEEALYERERLLDLAQTGAELGVWERDLKTGSSHFNDEWLRMFGLRDGKDPISRDACFARIHPADRRRVEVETEAAIAWDGSFNSEFRVIWPDGSVRWLSGKGQLRRNAAGAPTHFLAIGMDITARKQSEAALADASGFLQAVIDSAPNMIFVADAREKCLLANRKGAEYYGATPEELMRKEGGRSEAIVQGDLALMTGSADVIRTGKETCAMVKHAAPDGTWRWFQVIQAPLSRPDGSVVALGIATEVTEWKRAEESLKAKENHLRTILDAEPECVALMAVDGSLLDINPAGLALIEADSPEQVLGQNICGLINPEYREKYQELHRQVFDGAPFRMEFGVIGLKGTSRWLETQATPLRDAAGNIFAALGVTRDFTGRKKLETDLQLASARLLHAKAMAQLGSFSEDLVSGKIEYSAEIYSLLGSAPPVMQDDRRPPDADDSATGRMLYGDGEQVRTAYRELAANGTEMDVTFRWRRPDNEVRYIHIKGSRELDAEGNPVRTFGVIQDITGHRQMLERLRQLTEHQEKVREEERTRIAREIHDELGQQLTSLKMRAAWTERLVNTSTDTANAERARAELSAMSEALESTIRTVRRIAAELRPPVLDALGLIPALEWLRGSFERDHGIGCVADLRCGKVSPEAATTVFRVAQEALTNVARHAGASQVHMRLAERDGSLILDVEDDGHGMTPDAFSRQGSFGLIGIRERALLSKGRVDFLEAQKGGVLLRLTLPNELSGKITAERVGN